MLTSRNPSALTAAAAAVFLTASHLALASPNEHAVDTEGVSGNVPLVYGDHTVNARLASSVELDGYSFVARAGDKIRAVVQTATGGIDATLSLLGPTGIVVGSSTCTGNDVLGRGILCSTSLDRSLPTTGTYTFNVSDDGGNEAGSYELHLDLYPPTNNWVGIVYGAAVNDELGHTTDMDFYAINGSATTGIRLAVASQSGGIDTALEVWSPSGKSLFSSSCVGNDVLGRPILCTTTADLDLSESGVYTLGVWDSGWNEGGSYALQASCRFGNCPVGPVPEPATQGLWLAGMGGLALWLRRRRQ